MNNSGWFLWCVSGNTTTDRHKVSFPIAIVFFRVNTKGKTLRKINCLKSINKWESLPVTSRLRLLPVSRYIDTSWPARRCSGNRAPLNFVASLLWLHSANFPHCFLVQFRRAVFDGHLWKMESRRLEIFSRTCAERYMCWQPEIIFLYLCLFRSPLHLTPFLSQRNTKYLDGFFPLQTHTLCGVQEWRSGGIM